MNRRIFMAGSASLLAGCAGAGVSTVDLRDKVAAEVGQVVVTRTQLAPWIFETSVEAATLDASIGTVRSRIAGRHAEDFAVEHLHDLRRFYSSPDGQAVLALAYAAEGGREKPLLDIEQFARVERTISEPLTARSIAVIREELRRAFSAEFAFG